MTACYLFGLHEFPGGNCAQWFSGSTSAAAVIVALAANFYAAWRSDRQDNRTDAAEVASIAMLLRVLLKESLANSEMFVKGSKKRTILGNEYLITRPFQAVKAQSYSLMTKGQSDVLLRNGQTDLAEAIDYLISSINLLNIGVEDYSKDRISANEDLKKCIKLSKVPFFGRSRIESSLNKITGISHSAQYLRNKSLELYKECIETIKQYNIFCNSRQDFFVYNIDISAREDAHVDSRVQSKQDLIEA